VIKRLFDIGFSLVSILLLLPLIIVISIIILLSSGSPVLYKSQRVGLNGKIFNLYKFRTMKVNSEKIGPLNVASNDNRITKIGGILRRSKIDEIPQFINVFIGDLSIVGPRPDIKFYTDQYNQDERKILSILPGITDWASLVNFSQHSDFLKSSDPDTTFKEQIRPIKIILQMYYLEHRNFIEDLLIILLTALKFFFKVTYLPSKIKELIKIV
jgi:lipopolysaccharide/colanic/teichoic acid biosynthesis glycosyltransferase